MMNSLKGASRRLFLSLGIVLIWLITISVPAIAENTGNTCAASHYDESAVVRYIHDGDTVRLNDGRKVRLIGINTPEMPRDRKPEQAYARQARDQLRQLISSSGNRVKLVYGKERHDRYKRMLAHLFLPDGQNLQAALLQQGLATANVHPPNEAFTDCYQRAEQVARCSSTGLWSHRDYAIKSSVGLKPDAEGFSIVSGKLESISESRKGLWLLMQGGLMISIRSQDLARFDKHELKSLTHKKISVRGWISAKNKPKDKVKFYMRVRHPSAITPDATTVSITKC